MSLADLIRRCLMMNTSLPTVQPAPYDEVVCWDVTPPVEADPHKGIQTVLNVMIDGHWRTLQGIRCHTGLCEGTAARYLRALRERENGSYVIHKRRVPCSTIYEYRVEPMPQQELL